VLSDANDLRPKGDTKGKPDRNSAKRGPRLPEGADAPDEPAPAPAPMPAKGSVWLGIEMQNTEEGVIVSQTIEGSPAQKGGLQLEDVITKVDGKSVGGTGDIISRVKASAPGDKLKLTVKRGEKEQDLEITLAARKYSSSSLSTYLFQP
jgi:predicted metalloprotease with PDZ domain